MLRATSPKAASRKSLQLKFHFVISCTLRPKAKAQAKATAKSRSSPVPKAKSKAGVKPKAVAQSDPQVDAHVTKDL